MHRNLVYKKIEKKTIIFVDCRLDWISKSLIDCRNLDIDCRIFDRLDWIGLDWIGIPGQKGVKLSSESTEGEYSKQH